MTVLASALSFRFGRVVHESNELQFWGSEQYVRDIPLASPQSYADPRWRWMLALPTPTMRAYRARAADLNAQELGDAACFYFHKDQQVNSDGVSDEGE